MNEHSISSYYETDHDRLDELFQRYQSMKRNNFPQARECFDEFRIGLRRHIVWEEEILFPQFEAKTGMINHGPTEVMRAEHRLIKQYLEAIHRALNEGNPSSDDNDQMLLNSLFAHNQKEERILYPAIDRSLDEEERLEIFSTMKHIPEERYS